MVASGAELPPLRPDDVGAREFPVVKRGYDPVEVRAFLRAVAERIRRLEGEMEWHRARVDHLRQRLFSAQESAYSRLSRDFADVVREADEAVARARADVVEEARAQLDRARAEARRMVEEARGKARRIVAEGRGEAQRIVERAWLEAERVVREAGRAGAPGAGGSVPPSEGLADLADLDLQLDPSTFDLLDEAEPPVT